MLLFFFNDTATTEIYTLSLHDALPIWGVQACLAGRTATFAGMGAVSAEVPQFRERLLKASERSNVLDQAEEHRRLLGAAWVLITNEHGVLVARTDYPTEFDIDLSRGAL